MLQKIQRFTQDANEMMRANYLQNIWSFQDLHKMDQAPAYIHRIRQSEIKHCATIGETLVIVNNKDDNVDVYGSNTPQVLKTLNI